MLSRFRGGLAEFRRNFRSQSGFVWSSGRFLVKVARRSIAALVLVLLRPDELYSRFQPDLSATARAIVEPIVVFLHRWQNWIALLILVGVILWTYYEAERAGFRTYNKTGTASR